MGDYQRHESYGLVGFHRVTGNFKDQLFASNVDTGAAIKLEIKRAEVKRDLHRNWYYGHDQMIEVYLSPAQFSQLLTTMNAGQGVPCTIKQGYTEGFKRMESPPIREDNDAQKTKKEFERKMREIGKKLDLSRIREILSQKTIKKADKEEILGLFAEMKNFWTNHASFAMGSFEEATEEIVTEAKAEVEALVVSAVMKTGLKALKNQNNEEGVKELE